WMRCRAMSTLCPCTTLFRSGAGAAARRPEPGLGRVAGAGRAPVRCNLRRPALRRFVGGGERGLHQRAERNRPIPPAGLLVGAVRSEEQTSELQSREKVVCCL